MEAMLKPIFSFQSPVYFLFPYYATSRVRMTFQISGSRRESCRLFFLEPIQHIYWKTALIIWPEHVLTDNEMLLSSMRRCLCWMFIQSLLLRHSYSIHDDPYKLWGLATCSHLRLLISIWWQWWQLKSTYILYVNLSLYLPWPFKTFDCPG